MPAIWIRVDAAGEWPVMLDDGDEMLCASGVEWRFVSMAATHQQGRALIEQLHREREARAETARLTASLRLPRLELDLPQQDRPAAEDAGSHRADT